LSILLPSPQQYQKQDGRAEVAIESTKEVSQHSIDLIGRLRTRLEAIALSSIKGKNAKEAKLYL
jgi:hypothetical protein